MEPNDGQMGDGARESGEDRPSKGHDEDKTGNEGGHEPVELVLDTLYPRIRVSTRMWVLIQILCPLKCTQLTRRHVGISWLANVECTSA